MSFHETYLLLMGENVIFEINVKCINHYQITLNDYL